MKLRGKSRERTPRDFFDPSNQPETKKRPTPGQVSTKKKSAMMPPPPVRKDTPVTIPAPVAKAKTPATQKRSASAKTPGLVGRQRTQSAVEETRRAKSESAASSGTRRVNSDKKTKYPAKYEEISKSIADYIDSEVRIRKGDPAYRTRAYSKKVTQKIKSLLSFLKKNIRREISFKNGCRKGEAKTASGKCVSIYYRSPEARKGKRCFPDKKGNPKVYDEDKKRCRVDHERRAEDKKNKCVSNPAKYWDDELKKCRKKGRSMCKKGQYYSRKEGQEGCKWPKGKEPLDFEEEIELGPLDMFEEYGPDVNQDNEPLDNDNSEENVESESGEEDKEEEEELKRFRLDFIDGKIKMSPKQFQEKIEEIREKYATKRSERAAALAQTTAPSVNIPSPKEDEATTGSPKSPTGNEAAETDGPVNNETVEETGPVATQLSQLTNAELRSLVTNKEITPDQFRQELDKRKVPIPSGETKETLENRAKRFGLTK
jgi:hypothetical protein